MKKISIILVLALVISNSVNAQKLLTKEGVISFFSKTMMEDIDAKCDKAAGLLDVGSKTIVAKIVIKSFIFKDKLMQDHFNENYMESDKFPTASLQGKYDEDLNIETPGTYTINFKGLFEIHGVKKSVVIPITVVVSKTQVETSSIFKIRLADYNIEIPKLVTKNIAEVIEVKSNFKFNK
jgi:hypothetical protein